MCALMAFFARRRKNYRSIETVVAAVEAGLDTGQGIGKIGLRIRHRRSSGVEINAAQLDRVDVLHAT
jgi:hypothetical protein